MGGGFELSYRGVSENCGYVPGSGLGIRGLVCSSLGPFPESDPDEAPGPGAYLCCSGPCLRQNRPLISTPVVLIVGDVQQGPPPGASY